MKLLEEIIALLSSEEANLATALLKTKILLHRLGEKELLPWVNGELNGYQTSDNLPPYRILNVTIKANVSNMAYRYSSQTLPLLKVDEQIRKKIETSYLIQSIAVIEEYSTKDDLQLTILPEFYPYLEKGLANGFRIENAWGEHAVGAMTQVVIEVKSRLLDFVLELSERFTEELDISNIKKLSKKFNVSDIFNNAVFGDNATIVIGNSNNQEVKNIVVKNDLSSLKKILSDNGVSEDDINELAVAIDADKGCDEISKKSFGKNVSKWIGNMVTKAASTAWDIKVGAASSLLATAIGKYYGF